MSEETPFEWIDSHSIQVGNFDLLYMFSNIKVIRRNIKILVALSSVLWAVLGFDSTWEMLNPLITAVFNNPASVATELFNPASPLRVEMWSYYGVGDHWSAPVIYGLAFLSLSRHLERNGVVKSMNFFCSTALSLMSIGVFEIVYNRLYSMLQGQWWTFNLVFPNARNIIFFSSFIFMGVVALIMLYTLGYRVTVTNMDTALLLLSVSLWVIWVWYPFPVTQITVKTDWGIWMSSRMFPQTFYAVDIYNDGLAFGVPYYAENNLLHLVNTLCKVASTVFMLNLFKVKKYA